MRKTSSPNYSKSPISGNPRTLYNSSDSENPAWQFTLFDKENELWGWKALEKNIKEIFFFLSSLEGMSWHDIKQQNGGRGINGGTNHHSVLISDLTKLAKNRMNYLKLDEHEELFSLRVNNTRRIYGIKHNKILKILWYDEYHGNNNKAVFPTKKR